MAAVGRAFVGATVSVTDSTGKTVTAPAKVGADGKYSVDVTGLVAPLVVSAKGMVGDAEVTLVSAVVGTLPASGSVAITVSPLTNAVAAMLAPSGDPAALAPANVTALALAATGFGFRGVGLFLSDAQFVRRESSVQCAVGRSAVRG